MILKCIVEYKLDHNRLGGSTPAHRPNLGHGAAASRLQGSPWVGKFEFGESSIWPDPTLPGLGPCSGIRAGTAALPSCLPCHQMSGLGQASPRSPPYFIHQDQGWDAPTLPLPPTCLYRSWLGYVPLPPHHGGIRPLPWH